MSKHKTRQQNSKRFKIKNRSGYKSKYKSQYKIRHKSEHNSRYKSWYKIRQYKKEKFRIKRQKRSNKSTKVWRTFFFLLMYLFFFFTTAFLEFVTIWPELFTMGGLAVNFKSLISIKCRNLFLRYLIIEIWKPKA